MSYDKMQLFQEFMNFRCGFQVNDSLDEIRESLNRAKQYNATTYAEDVQTFKEYTLDESIPFMKKVKVMLECDPTSEEQAVDVWKDIWNLITEGEPFPFDEHGKLIR